MTDEKFINTKVENWGSTTSLIHLKYLNGRFNKKYYLGIS